MSQSRRLRVVLVFVFWVGVGIPTWMWIADVREKDQKVASQAQTFQEEIKVGMTRQEVRDLATRFEPNENWTSAFWFNSRWQVHRVKVDYTPATPREGQPEDKTVNQKRNKSQTSPDDRVASVNRDNYWTSYNEKSLVFDFVKFVTSPQIFLISLPFLLLWGISRIVKTQIWRAALKPFWVPAVLWAAYGVWENFIMRQDGIRGDRMMIWPFLFLVPIGTALLASWRLVQADSVENMAD